jgi:hypothetical protein
MRHDVDELHGLVMGHSDKDDVAFQRMRTDLNAATYSAASALARCDANDHGITRLKDTMYGRDGSDEPSGLIVRMDRMQRTQTQALWTLRVLLLLATALAAPKAFEFLKIVP